MDRESAYERLLARVAPPAERERERGPEREERGRRAGGTLGNAARSCARAARSQRR